MNIIIKSRNCELTPSFREFIEQKFGSLEKYFNIFKGKEKDNPEWGKARVEMIVEIEKTTEHHRKGDLFQVECHLNFPRKTLTATALSEDMQNSVIMAREELQRQITDYKDKMIKGSRKA